MSRLSGDSLTPQGVELYCWGIWLFNVWKVIMHPKFYEILRDNSLVQVLILSLSILICYYGLWNAYFASEDDFNWTGLMRHRHTLAEAAQGLGNGVRFLNYAMVWIKTRLFDLNAAPYFWSSLFQNALVTFIIYWLAEFWTGRRATAFLAALLFATTFSHFEVVTGISASDYSFWAIFYVTTLALFAVYLRRRALPWYLGSVGAYAILAFAHDFTLSMPLVLLAYHLTLGRGAWKIRSLGWADLRLHFPFWILWGVHVSIQFFYVFAGTSEAVYSEHAYKPGWHMIGNLFYLIFLALPNVRLEFIYGFLTAHVSAGLVETIWQLTVSLAMVSLVLTVIFFWKGSSLVRFTLALIYLPFLQYTLWQGDFAKAPRYLYLPSIGYSILLALILMRLYAYLRQKEDLGYRLIVPGIVTMLLVANLIMNQVWVQRQITNGKFRRAFVTQLAANFQEVKPGSLIYIEVPAAKFTDLAFSCRLVLQQPVNCEAFVSGERSIANVTRSVGEKPVYWLQATSAGFNQIYPPISASP